MIREARAEDISQLKEVVSDEWYWPFLMDDHYTTLLFVNSDRILGVASVSITLGTANIDFILVAERSLTRSWSRTNECDS